MIWNVWEGNTILGIVNEPTEATAKQAATLLYGTGTDKKGRYRRHLKVLPAVRLN